MKSDHVPLVQVTRSRVVECLHRGSVVVCQGNKIIETVGNQNTITPTRSTAKPFQTIPLVRYGGVQAFNLSNEELSLISSSHNGEERHLEVARRILTKANISEDNLQCGIHPPFFFEITQEIFKQRTDGPLPIHNNCSGKHIGMLLLCKLLGFPFENYWEFNHPVQTKIINDVMRILEMTENNSTFGVDGCGVPTFNVTLLSLAKAYAYLASNQVEKELLIIRNAIIEAPFMLAGSNRLDTVLIELKRVIAKAGAQGVYCIAIPEEEIGIAIKIESGSDEASETVAVEIMRKLGFLDSNELKQLNDFLHFPVKTWRDINVGNYDPIF